MNKTTEALKLAEEALRFYVEDFDCAAADVIALAAIREALAEQEKQEPVSEITVRIDGTAEVELLPNSIEMNIGKHKLYAAPVDAKAIRAEALEEAAKVCESKELRGIIGNMCAAAIRGLI